MKFLVFIIVLAAQASAQAEVYRWTDANGKTHYSDKKIAPKAQNITREVNTQNIDTSTEEHKKVEQILRKKNDADRAYEQQQQHQQNAARMQRCNALKRDLNLLSGRVQFLDDDGKMMHISEQEKQQKVIELKQKIQQDCA